jgi:hypothetical protein
VSKEEEATVFKKVGDQHQMGAKGTHISLIDTGEKMFYCKHTSQVLAVL